MLIAGNRYQEAAIEYERIAFFASDPVDKARAVLNKAYCLKQRGAFVEAAKRLEQVPLPGLSDSLAYELTFQSALCYYLAADFLTASARLKNLAFRYPGSRELSRTAYLHTLVWNELQQYDSAFQSALRYIRNGITDTARSRRLTEEITVFYAPEHRPALKNEVKAEWLSRFIPGLGQAWLGYPGEGSMSFLLNAVSLGVGALGILSGYPVSGYIIGGGLLQKFYFGGLRRTLYLSEKTNYERSRAFNDAFRERF